METSSSSSVRLNSAVTNSIMEFILCDDSVDIDVLRRSLRHQVLSVNASLSMIHSISIYTTELGRHF